MNRTFRVSILRHVLPALCALVPFAVGVEPGPRDSSWTSIRVAGATSSYANVSRGCNGEVLNVDQRDFRVYGGAIEHKFTAPIVVGVRGTVISPGDGTPPYSDWSVINPHLGLDLPKFGFDVGYNARGGVPEWPSSFEPSPVSGHFRFGRRQGTLLRISVSEGTPHFAPEGAGSVVLEFPVHSVRASLGVSGIVPYDQPGFLARVDVPIVKALHLDASGRLGASSGASENALGLGITWSFGRATRPIQVPVPDTARGHGGP